MVPAMDALSNKFIYKFIRETRRFSPRRGGKTSTLILRASTFSPVRAN
jgi:hypothetical protein